MVPAIIGAGAALLGSAFSARSQNSANHSNIRLAQMNNEWSERMMQKQMDYNTDMWNKMNEYNDPSNQVARLKKAGINPALALSNITTGSASSASSPSLPSPSQAAVQPSRFDFNGIGQSLQNAYLLQAQIEQMNAETRLIGNQADWYSAKAQSDLAEAYERTKNLKLKNTFEDATMSVRKNQVSADYYNALRYGQSLEQNIYNAARQGILMDKQIAKYDAETNARIADLVASATLKMAQGQLSKEQLKSQIEQTKGLKLSNKEKDAIFDYVVSKASSQAKGSNVFELFGGAWSRLENYFKR